MKKYIILLTLSIAIFLACQKESIDLPKEIFILVDSKTQEFHTGGSDTLSVGIKIKESHSTDWSASISL